MIGFTTDTEHSGDTCNANTKSTSLYGTEKSIRHNFVRNRVWAIASFFIFLLDVQTFESKAHHYHTEGWNSVNKKPQKVKSDGRRGTKETNNQKWLMTMEKCSQVLMFLVSINGQSWLWLQRCFSVHLHLFCARLCLLVSLCVSLSLCSWFGCRDIINSTALVIHFRGLLHCGLWPVEDWITYIL